MFLCACAAYAAQALWAAIPAPLTGAAPLLAIPGVRARVRSRDCPPTAWLLGLLLGVAAAVIVYVAWVVPLRQSTIFYPGITPEFFKTNVYVVVSFALAAAIVNSLFEEALWRGSAFDLLRRFTGSWYLATLLCAIAFGLAHINGVPDGSSGVLLALAFGLAAQALVAKSAGALGPVLVAHAIADVTVILALN